MRQPILPSRSFGLAARNRPAERGFALLVTITLLAFLVLLLVSLATLTRVETQVAANGQKLSEARQSAVLALNIAIGQLQRHAGPDQRVSAPSNAGDSSVNPGRSDARPNWVGIWENQTPAANTTSPRLITWLVSGNESPAAPLALLPTTAIADPAGPLSGTVWLVGDNSVIQESSGSWDKRIKLPKQEIKAPEVPGLSGAQTIGRYAWWVGDEGVKAPVNLADPHANSTPAERGFSFVNSQRSAIELVDRSQSATPLGSVYPSPADALFTSLDKISALRQLSFASSAADAAIADAVTKARFHDLTAGSYSVLADATQGGLKKDLSSGLAAGASEPANASPLFPVTAGKEYGVPTWEMLRSYAGIQVPAAGTAPLQPLAAVQFTAAQGPRLGTGPVVVGPVVTYASLGFNYSVSPADGTSVNLNLFPAAVLWNPYTVTLPAKDYTLGFSVRTSEFVSLQLRRWVEIGTPGNWQLAVDQPGVDQTRLTVEFRLYTEPGTFTADGAYTRFKVSSPPIPPGQSLVFTLPTSTGLGTAYDPVATTLVNAINPTESVVVPARNAAGEAVTLATPVTIAGKTASADQFDLYHPGVSAETGVLLTEFDERPPGSPADLLPPPASTTRRWFQGLLRVPRGKDSSTALPGDTWITRPRGTLPTALALRDVDAAPVSYWFEYLPTMAANPVTAYAFPLPWVAHGNPRGVAMARLWLDRYVGAIHPAYTLRKTRVNSTLPRWPTFNYDPADPRASSGTYLDNNGTPEEMTLWEFATPQLGLLSLGQLQHANLSTVGDYPAYAIGNSLTDFRVARDQPFSDGGTKSSINYGVTNQVERHYDLSWNLNRALWDRYFFSTVPSGQAPTSTQTESGARPAWTQANLDAKTPLPNSRMHYYGQPVLGSLVKTAAATSDPYHQAAAHLLVAGGFNINSTSEQAWRAVLAGSTGLHYRPEAPASGAGAALKAAFPRFAVPTGDDSTQTVAGMWQGYRQLDENQIKRLAANIVAEVKARGPFLSLADFVNRRLVAAGGSKAATGLKGTLQAAIDAAQSGADAVNPANLPPFNANPVDATSQGDYILEHLINDDDTATTAAHRSRSAFTPKFLTQADILTALGPMLAARSDTFTIRAYGEAVNPVLAPADPGYVNGQAWCEAVVQRVPDYINAAADAAETHPATNPDNLKFGRRFIIISFRWLTPADI